MKRFNREVLKVEEAENKVQMTTFKASLKSKELVVAFAKSPSDLMIKMLLKAQKYMNAEDALATIGMGDTQKERRYILEDSKGKKEGKKRLFVQPQQCQVKER